jgi:prefoldin subunit 5
VILEKRELYLSELGIECKRDEIQRLESIERIENENLCAKEAEICLFRDHFRTFLENDGKNTMEVRAAAEAKCRQRQELSSQIKAISSQISTLRSEIARHNEKLQECQDYKNFLEHLTPKEWRQSHPHPEMYFVTPDQLLDILVAGEEQNMFLIMHCQEAEETFERYRKRFNDLLGERDGEIMEMLARKDRTRKELEEMQAKEEQYKVVGEFRQGNELSEPELSELREAIRLFHTALGFDPASSNDTTTMLTRIENTMEELTEKLAKVEKKMLTEKAMEKEDERREQERTEKNDRAKRDQEEKTQKALQLAMMPIKRRTGRPLNERMIPKTGDSREKKEEALRRKQAREEADRDLLYGAIWD